MYQASYAFAGTEVGDLSFSAGDIITVTSMDGEWWTGTLKGKSGIFPANYVAPHKVEVRKRFFNELFSCPLQMMINDW